ncbi:alpha/beta fold hydrolase [Methylophaga sp. OBS4]|uniref:alpha/beta fold hydrolase n=1 Tax=Methylophaga sp. OBS4 TaxID=2991935 RepID=UPI0022536D2D|nr:alpha/beta fold hydrolase [Methylophaga sp. OBS4]MCX4186234.1 alpha/beta hydrolase [Methylophaga sp. OBS4]
MSEKEYRINLDDGRMLACLELGNASGEAVIYCHGYPGSRLEARLAEQAVKRLGLRLIAPDRPGFGESSFQAGRTIGAWANDIKQLADQLGLERFSILGVSGGGPYTLACAAGIPERINQIALVGALAPLSGMHSTRDMVAFNRMVLTLGTWYPALARRVVGLMARWFRRQPESLFKFMLAGAPEADKKVIDDPGFKVIWLASVKAALLQGGQGVAWELPLLAQPWDFNLEQVLVPVQIWHGLSDTVVPATMARYLVETLPHNKVHYLQGEGHFSLMVRHLDTVLEDLCR